LKPFIVVWWEIAQSRLAELWIAAADRTAIRRAADEIDRRLATNPKSCVEGDQEGLCRMTIEPLSVQFTIDEENQAVTIWTVRSDGRSSRGLRDAAMNPTEKPNRLGVWGHSMMNQLPGSTRKRRKREASKKRRVIERREVERRVREGA
jgi:hypothetical protein